MRKVFTIEDLKGTACAKLNGHLLNAPKSVKLKNKLPRRSSKAIKWLDANLQAWCNERSFTLECKANGKERMVDPLRKWRFDYAIESIMVAIEYEGGIFLEKSGHNTAKHYTKDTDKYNRAAVLGWQVIRVTAMNYLTVLETLENIYQRNLNQ